MSNPRQMRFALALLALAVGIPVAVLILLMAPLQIAGSLFFLGLPMTQSRNVYRIAVRKDYSSVRGLDDKPLSDPGKAEKWWLGIDAWLIIGGILACGVYWLTWHFTGAMALYLTFILLPALVFRIIISAKFRAKSA